MAITCEYREKEKLPTTEIVLQIDPVHWGKMRDIAALAERFLQAGGRSFFYGGSGQIDKAAFEGGLDAIREAARDTPHADITILMGHPDHIPASNEQIGGVVVYHKLIGAGNSDYDFNQHLSQQRPKIEDALGQRGLAKIRTLYILACGDGESVLRSTGIQPLRLTSDYFSKDDFDHVLVGVSRAVIPPQIDIIWIDGPKTGPPVSAAVFYNIAIVTRLACPSGRRPIIWAGDGVKSQQDASNIARSGANKIIISTLAEENPDLDFAGFIQSVRP